MLAPAALTALRNDLLERGIAYCNKGDEVQVRQYLKDQGIKVREMMAEAYFKLELIRERTVDQPVHT